jgi:hypothetical protein
MRPDNAKDVTLADWLKAMGGRIEIAAKLGVGFTAHIPGIVRVDGATPEDALQALTESYYDDEDALLDIGRSAKWTAEHGPDGVAGLVEGELGVVALRDGALHLVEKMPYEAASAWHYVPGGGFLRVPEEPHNPDPAVPPLQGCPCSTFIVDDSATVPLSEETMSAADDILGRCRIAPDVTVGIPASAFGLQDGPPKSECLKASVESLLEGYLHAHAGGPAESTLHSHLLKVLVEAVVYLLERDEVLAFDWTTREDDAQGGDA